MDSSPDFDRAEVLRRALRAVRTQFPAPDGPRPDLPDPPDPGTLAGDEFTRRQLDLFTHLIDEVGDADALWRLDVIPVPDELFDWSVVELRDVAFVEQVLAWSDRCCVEMLDLELRTVTRRILALVAARDPRPLRRRPHAARCAASLVWLAGQANGEFSRRGRPNAAWLWAWFGVGNCSDRGRSLWRAAGLEPDPPSPPERLPLGDPALLHSRARAHLIQRRDWLLEVAGRRRTWSLAETDGPSARVEVRASPTKVVYSAKGTLADTGRATVLIGFGEHVDDANFVMLTVPDAHELVRRVQSALDAALPAVGR